MCSLNEYEIFKLFLLEINILSPQKKIMDVLVGIFINKKKEIQSWQ